MRDGFRRSFSTNFLITFDASNFFSASRVLWRSSAAADSFAPTLYVSRHPLHVDKHDSIGLVWPVSGATPLDTKRCTVSVFFQPFYRLGQRLD